MLFGLFDVLAGHAVVFDIKPTCPTVVIIVPSSGVPDAVLSIRKKIPLLSLSSSLTHTFSAALGTAAS
jgi:hypothetical protein